jgi:hypothetical protein
VLQARSKLDVSYQSITEGTSRLATHFGEWQGDSRANGPAGMDPLEALKSDLLQIEKLNQQVGEMRRDGCASARLAVEASAHLAPYLEEVKTINRDMHLLALNAIVRTVALGGQGHALQALSSQVQSWFVESDREVTKLILMLEATLSETTAITQDNLTTAGTASDLDNPNSGVRDRVDGITLAYEQFCQISEPAGRLTERQKELLAGGHAGLVFLGDLAESISQQVQDLAGIRQTLAPWKSPSDSPKAETADPLAHTYTMQSERDIHERVTAAASSLAATAPPPSSGSLELFAKPPASLNATEKAPPILLPPDAKPADQALSPPDGKDGSKTPSDGQPAATDPGLGDNVELF